MILILKLEFQSTVQTKLRFQFVFRIISQYAVHQHRFSVQPGSKQDLHLVQSGPSAFRKTPT